MLFAAPAKAVADRDAWIGWTALERQRFRHRIVSNSRFLILPGVRVPYLASHVLGLAVRRLRADWIWRYGFAPVLLETFVHPQYRGTCYQAANWLRLGETSGFARMGKTYVRHGNRKSVFVYLLNPSFLRIISEDPCRHRTPQTVSKRVANLMLNEPDWSPDLLKTIGLNVEAVEQLGPALDEYLAYFDGTAEELSQDLHVELHYTNMTGSEPDAAKIPVTSFIIKDHKRVDACPEGHAPYSCQFNGHSKVIIAYFSLDKCASCPLQEICPVTIRKNNAVLRIEQNTLFAAEARDKVKDKRARIEAGRKRAAIEGTNSALKRSQGAGNLRVRGIVKARLAMGMKIIGHNFKQIVNFFNDDIRGKSVRNKDRTGQGVIMPI